MMGRFIKWNMTKKGKWLLLAMSMLLLAVLGCSNENKLEKVIRKELASGVRDDTLFLGLEFGINQQEFYDHCWALNKQGLVREGAENMSVRYMFKDSLENPISFDFYTDRLADESIHRYYASFYYYAWVLNRHLQSDRLFPMLVPILMDWYGGNEPFYQIIDGKKHMYKIDGNRMIDLVIHNESTVVAIFSDLSYYYPEKQ